jgi:heme/copper-type cytochrome/quinol oxidase subunit 2
MLTSQSMLRMNYLAVIVAAVAAFVASLVWYAIFGNAWMELRGIDSATAADTGTPAWTMLFVVIQSLVVAFMLAYFVVHFGVVDWRGAVRLGALVWVFPAMILLGSVVHENVRLMLAAIHAGDWLVKILLMTVILGVWRKGHHPASHRISR